MDGLSGVASGMAVASLALQLLQSVNAIKMFISDVECASRELERLRELLNRLGSLFDDVRNIMERQTSLQQCPPPLQTIFDCLKRCESSLDKLHDLARKYGHQHGNNRTIKKLRNDMAFALKTQHFAHLEERMQRDIDNLHAALTANTANIQLATLSVLLRFEQASLVSSPPPPRFQIQARQPPNLSTKTMLERCSRPLRSNMTTKIRQWCIDSPLDRFGIYQRRRVRRVLAAGERAGADISSSNAIMSISHELYCYFLGYGICWTQQYPYGNILPALRIFPLVQDLFHYDSLIRRGTIFEIQQALSSGVIHPYTRDTRGWTLLHSAAAFKRADVCQLLHAYGADLEFSNAGFSPLYICLNGPLSEHSMNSVDIDTLRTLLVYFDQIDDAGPANQHLVEFAHLWSTYWDLNVAKWLWYHASLVFDGVAFMRFRGKILQDTLKSYSESSRSCDNEKVKDMLVEIMNDHYLHGTDSLLQDVFWDQGITDCESKGAAFIALLTKLGLDVEACIATEIKRCGGILRTGSRSPLAERCVIFEVVERANARSYVLRWEWLCEPETAGHEIVPELRMLLGSDKFFWLDSFWPFCERTYRGGDWHERYEKDMQKRNARFERRGAAKARKERARNGEKQERSKMPGTWKWN